MAKHESPQLRPGQQPYDSLNGLRVGALAGGLVGALATWVLNSPPWPVLVVAVGGGAIGYWSEHRKRSEP